MKKGTERLIKFQKLQRRLKESKRGVIGLLELLWAATAEQAPQGDIGRFSNEDIATLCDWDGDPDELVRHLVETSWLDLHSECRLVVHDWSDHAPGYIRAQLQKKGLSFVSPVSVISDCQRPSTTPDVVTQEQGGMPSSEHSSERSSDGSSDASLDGSSDRTPILFYSNNLSYSNQTLEREASLPPDQRNDVPPDPHPDETPSEFSFPIVGGTQLPLSQRKVDAYRQTYGHRVDVDTELRKAAVWLDDRPANRPRNARGLKQFLTGWLNRSDEQARRSVTAARASPRGGENKFNLTVEDIFGPQVLT